MLDLRLSSDRNIFSEDKHYMGQPCNYGHVVDGKTWRHRSTRHCVKCGRERASKWNKENPDRHKFNIKKKDRKRRSAILTNRQIRRTYPITMACTSARCRSREMGIPCDITSDSLKNQWIDQGGRCYWTGVPLSFDIALDRHALKPSLDRLIPSDGYVVGNVVWASNFANRARSDCPADEFAEVLKKVFSAYKQLEVRDV